jgi:ketosteroid isomerase-like protein
MENIPDTPLGRMYREHIKLIKEKNIEQLLDQYTDDCLLISSFMKEPLYYHGREQLREHMNGILGIDDLDTDIAFWAETENPQTLMIVEAITMKTADAVCRQLGASRWPDRYPFRRHDAVSRWYRGLMHRIGAK